MARHLVAVLVIAWGLWMTGCGRNPSGPAADQGADRAAILRAVAAAPELAVDFSDDAGELLGTAEPAASTTAQGPLLAPADTGITANAPIHWGRRRTPSDRPSERIVDFILPPDSGRAVVRVTVRFDGWLYVDRTDDGLRNPGKKPVRDQAVRTALFRKIWFHADSSSADSMFGWRLVALSPVEFSMIDPARQTVAIRSVTVTTPAGATTITDPTAFLSLRDGGPAVPSTMFGQAVKVEAEVTNTDRSYRPSEFVYLHVPINMRPFPGPFDRVRIRMRDDGSNGDLKAGDGIYTAQWTVQDVGRHHLAVDVLSARCLQTESGDDYNSTTWGIPYASYPAMAQ
ncbi:MAG TPA: choice-of-anchor X domain-containing protein [Candidatus Omnitrophota bacterium]|nr:choice-of-anchor X domain-containing protein [Candidatus Omnitrophota bacterium]